MELANERINAKFGKLVAQRYCSSTLTASIGHARRKLISRLLTIFAIVNAARKIPELASGAFFSTDANASILILASRDCRVRKHGNRKHASHHACSFRDARRAGIPVSEVEQAKVAGCKLHPRVGSERRRFRGTSRFRDKKRARSRDASCLVSRETRSAPTAEPLDQASLLLYARSPYVQTSLGIGEGNRATG